MKWRIAASGDMKWSPRDINHQVKKEKMAETRKRAIMGERGSSEGFVMMVGTRKSVVRAAPGIMINPERPMRVGGERKKRIDGVV